MAAVVLLCYFATMLWANNELSPPESVVATQSLMLVHDGTLYYDLEHYPFTEWWIGTSIAGFLLLVASWLGFVYFLAAAQQQNAQHRRNTFYRRAQSIMLLLCGLSLALMIFSMANRFTGPPGSV